MSEATIRIGYINWRGEHTEREITPRYIWFGRTQWHPEDQWLLQALDIEKNAFRDFALKDIEFRLPFQARVGEWLIKRFGEAIANDIVERNHRFLEEALELVQANGCTVSEAHQLVDYVYGRPVGELVQEAGGVMNTLAALLRSKNVDLNAAAELELARVNMPEVMEKIRAKQAAKPKHSPLPEGAPVFTGIDLGWERPHDCVGACQHSADCKRRPRCDDPPGSL